MKTNSDDIKTMAKSGCCPCCKQSVSGALQQHIASTAGETLPTAESYREGRRGVVDLREAGSAQRLTEPAEKDRERYMNRTARAMGIKTAEGLRLFREGRLTFDPNYYKPEVARV
jgi:hypothetical protein